MRIWINQLNLGVGVRLCGSVLPVPEGGQAGREGAWELAGGRFSFSKGKGSG